MIQKTKEKFMEYGIIKSIFLFLALAVSTVVFVAVATFFTLMLMEKYDERYTEPMGSDETEIELQEAKEITYILHSIKKQSFN